MITFSQSEARQGHCSSQSPTGSVNTNMLKVSQTFLGSETCLMLLSQSHSKISKSLFKDTTTVF